MPTPKGCQIPRSLNVKRYSSGFRLDVALAMFGKQKVYASSSPRWSAARNRENDNELTVWRMQISHALIRKLYRLAQKQAKLTQDGIFDL